MVKRERGVLWDTVLLNPFSVPGKQGGDKRELEMEFSQTAYDVYGGMLCDEPGLGKTITMVALILLTRGQSTQCMPVRVDAPTSNTANVRLRSSSHCRSLRAEDFVRRGRAKTIRVLRASGVQESRIANVIACMDYRMPKPPTECRSCHRQLHLLLVLPCGHLCCAEGAEKRYLEAGPSCYLCHEPYSREGFKVLQPGIHAEPLDDNDQRRKKVSINKKRKQADTKKSVRLVNLKRDFWRIESSKIIYMATRIRELMKEFSRPSRGQQDELKVIIFSQHRESIWSTKVAFTQQDIPTADFIALINPQQRIKNLKEFRSNPDVHVLLLSNLGSQGLDLSFVTHIFLLEEIWDKSVEQQVISRAHRMGARHSVVVEQLWDRESTQTQPTREEVQEASSADKSSFQQMKINYILSNLRVLGDDMAGKDGVHIISESGDVTTVSTMRTPSREPAASTTAVPSVSPQRNTPSTTGASRSARRKPTSPEIIVIDDSSSDEEHKSESDSEDEVRIPRLHLTESSRNRYTLKLRTKTRSQSDKAEQKSVERIASTLELQ